MTSVPAQLGSMSWSVSKLLVLVRMVLVHSPRMIAIVTHKGAAADSGHYIGYVKKNVFSRPPPQLSNASVPTANNPDPNAMETDEPAPAQKRQDQYAYEDDEDWYKFDDDKVSVFPKEKLNTLDGGGEDSSAYVLLYKSKST